MQNVSGNSGLDRPEGYPSDAHNNLFGIQTGQVGTITWNDNVNPRDTVVVIGVTFISWTRGQEDPRQRDQGYGSSVSEMDEMID
jgi:hypothetical protein